jgi:hypothetical protein
VYDGAKFALSVKKPADILRNSNPTFEFSDFLVSSGFWGRINLWMMEMVEGGKWWKWK